MPVALPSSLRSYLAEPSVADPPARVGRDWFLLGLISIAAILETVLRTDPDWVGLSLWWRVGALIVFFVSAPPAIMFRRTRPLAATLWAFAPSIIFGAAVARAEGVFGGLSTTAVILVVPYALYRWGSGRDGAVGAVVLLVAAVTGFLTDPTVTLSDWIGGLIFLSIPVEVGLIVRYRDVAKRRAVAEVQSREREQLARELHDTVAHHVSAIALQAQGGRALAETDPQRALAVLAVIEDAASRTLSEMRAMVGTLRAGADLAPQQGVGDLHRLAREVGGGVPVEVDIADDLGPIGAAIDAALFRIAQESITNAVRHARRASVIVVTVEHADTCVRLTVADDGEPSGAQSERGFGILGMTERAHLLGGSLTAGPAHGRGWRVCADLPRSGGHR
ncbi:MAG: sensor histidine kinase [Ilumatobacteraceae bacterium]